jgi:nickel transport protein
MALVVAAPGTAQAHRLEADYRVLPDQRVQIESWFDQGGIPQGARVVIYRPDNQIVAEGALNADGIFAFTYTQAEPLKVVVEAGGGHRKEFYILRDDLAKGLPVAPMATTAAEKPEGFDAPLMPLVDRSSRISIKDILLGIGFVLAVAAFVLSIRNGQRLRNLERCNKCSGEPGLLSPGEKLT